MPPQRYDFADYVLDIPAHKLTRDGKRVDLPPLSFALLVKLVREAPESASRQALTEYLWPDRVVGDEALTERVKLLRQAIEADRTRPTVLVTERGWGYRLAVTVRARSAEPVAQTPETEARSLAVLPLRNLTGDPQQEMVGFVWESLRLAAA